VGIGCEWVEMAGRGMRQGWSRKLWLFLGALSAEICMCWGLQALQVTTTEIESKIAMAEMGDLVRWALRCGSQVKCTWGVARNVGFVRKDLRRERAENDKRLAVPFVDQRSS
jgi:hypothetical protein